MKNFGVVTVGLGIFVSTALTTQAAVKMQVRSGGKTTVLEIPANSTIRVSAREMARLQTPQGNIRKITLIGKATISVFKNNRSLMRITADEAVIDKETTGSSNEDHSVIEVTSESVLIPALGKPNPSTAVVQEFLDDRLTGNMATSWALLTTRLQKALPSAEQRDKQVSLLSDPKYVAQLTPKARALMVVSMDFGNKLDYKFRVLGPAKDNANLVVIEAYPIAAPAEIATVQALIVQDGGAGGALRIDNLSTGWSNGATADLVTRRH